MLKIYHASTLLLLSALLIGCTAEQEGTERFEDESQAAMKTSETAEGEIGESISFRRMEVQQAPVETPDLALNPPQMTEVPKKFHTRSMTARPMTAAPQPMHTRAEDSNVESHSGSEPPARESAARESAARESAARESAARESAVRESAVRESASLRITPPESQPLAAMKATPPQTEEAYKTVQIFYGTDRKVTTGIASHPLGRIPWSLFAMATGIVTLLTIIICSFWVHGKKAVMIPLLLLLVTAGLGSAAVLIPNQTKPDIARTDVAYGNERGKVELGTCDVSIPACHKLAELEGPSIFRLEISEDPTKHVVLLGIDRLEEGPFLESLRETIQASEGQEAFIFIHGYNVTFEDAARRTAQLAYDLNFKGAPILYSWPSQGGLFKYTVDETNVDWTVSNLKEFLRLIAKQSGAKRVHLIAHSMGNRALTSALERLSYTDAKEGPIFNEVILTAPDIDAEIFRRDLAPRIVKTAQRVTLYASSNDGALIASKTVHGSPRAGESGEAVVVVPGIDTIDVSRLDTSLLGHSYYSSNDTVLIDMAQLLLESKPPTLRSRLRSITQNGLSYWVFFVENLRAEIKDRVTTPR